MSFSTCTTTLIHDSRLRVIALALVIDGAWATHHCCARGVCQGRPERLEIPCGSASITQDIMYLLMMIIIKQRFDGVVGYHVSLTLVSSLKVSSSSLGRIIFCRCLRLEARRVIFLLDRSCSGDTSDAIAFVHIDHTARSVSKEKENMHSVQGRRDPRSNPSSASVIGS
jgi:hypothetical protein